MSPAPRRYVMDASVGIKLCLAEALSDKADALVAMAAADPPWLLLVPDLFYVECANVLWKHVWKSGHPEEKAHHDIQLIAGLRLDRTPTAHLAPHALRIAMAEGITAYDGCYVALAEQAGAPLVTADEKLLKKLGSTAYDVRWLGDLDIP